MTSPQPKRWWDTNILLPIVVGALGWYLADNRAGAAKDATQDAMIEQRGTLIGYRNRELDSLERRITVLEARPCYSPSSPSPH